eukprot:scaffold42340_cov57-Phaeocystis_antarctica.AAC.3
MLGLGAARREPAEEYGLSAAHQFQQPTAIPVGKRRSRSVQAGRDHLRISGKSSTSTSGSSPCSARLELCSDAVRFTSSSRASSSRGIHSLDSTSPHAPLARRRKPVGVQRVACERTGRPSTVSRPSRLMLRAVRLYGPWVSGGSVSDRTANTFSSATTEPRSELAVGSASPCAKDSAPCEYGCHSASRLARVRSMGPQQGPRPARANGAEVWDGESGRPRVDR